MPSPQRIDMTGQRYARLTVLHYAGRSADGAHALWTCRCDCGNETTVTRLALVHGRVKSCGCLQREKAATLHKSRMPIMKTYMAKRLNSLVPVDDVSMEELKKIGQGEIVSVEIRRPRNVQHHRKFFALLRVMVQATDLWPNEEALLTDLKFQIGHTEKLRRANGEVVEVPKSISFGSLSQDEFDSFYDRAITAMCEMCNEIDADALRQVVLEQLASA